MADPKKAEEEALAARLLQDVASDDDGSEDDDEEGEGESPPHEPDEAPPDAEQNAPEDDENPTVEQKGVKKLPPETYTQSETGGPTDVTFEELANGIRAIVKSVVAEEIRTSIPDLTRAISADVNSKMQASITKALSAPIGDGENAQSIAKALMVLLGRTSTIKKGIADLDTKVDAGNSSSDAIAKALPSLAATAEKSDQISKAMQNLVRTTPAVSTGTGGGQVIEKGVVDPPVDTGQVDASGLTASDRERLTSAVQKARAHQETTGQPVPQFSAVLSHVNAGTLTKGIINEFASRVDALCK